MTTNAEIVERPAKWLEEELAKPSMQQKIVTALEGGLEAVRFVWDGKKQQARAEPDYATRTKSAQICLEYILGRPVERQQVLIAHQKADDPETLIQRSPALRKRLKELVKDEVKDELEQSAS